MKEAEHKAMKCSYIKKNGAKCSAFSVENSKVCFAHDPSKREDFLDASRKGGLVKQFTTDLPPIMVESLADITSLLVDTINQVRGGTIHPQLANTVGYLASQLAKIIEIQQSNGSFDNPAIAAASPIRPDYIELIRIARGLESERTVTPQSKEKQ